MVPSLRQSRRSRTGRIVLWSLITAGALIALAGLGVWGYNLLVTRSAKAHIVPSPEGRLRPVRHRARSTRVRRRHPAPMLVDRLQTGIELYKLGKVDKILLSGDHGQTEYDEVNVMLDYCLETGHPR